MQLTYSFEHGHMDLLISKEVIHLDQLWIDQKFRRRGFGTSLMNRLGGFADEMGLSVSLNARGDIPQGALVHFYTTHGFQLQDANPWVMLMERSPRS